MKICFVSRNAYSALSGSNLEHVGGVERQQVLLTSWFVEKGDDVSVITWRPENDVTSNRNDIRFYFTCAQDDGLPLVRFLYPRWTSLVSALAEADADLYYYNIGDVLLGQIAAWAKRAGRRTVYSVSSDMSCYDDLHRFMPWREKLLYLYGLRNVSAVFTQTNVQSELLHRNYEVASTVIPMSGTDMGASALRGESISRERSGERLSILWVGRFSPEKRANWLLDIAAECVEFDFKVVGQANASSAYSDRFIWRAAELDNVALCGVVSHQEMAGYYQTADILLCTSQYEGLPNVFIEAWSARLPVVSTFDPDSVLAEQNLGVTCSSRDDITRALRSLAVSAEHRRECGLRAREHFERFHSKERAMSIFDDAIRQVLES